MPTLVEALALSTQTEAQLDTHDVALPLLPYVVPSAAPSTAPFATPSPRVLRAIFVGPEDVGSEATRARLERLYRFNGGNDVLVVFLLKRENERESPMASFMRLQQE